MQVAVIFLSRLRTLRGKLMICALVTVWTELEAACERAVTCACVAFLSDFTTAVRKVSNYNFRELRGGVHVIDDLNQQNNQHGQQKIQFFS